MNTKIIWFELLAYAASLLALPVIWKSRSLRLYPVLLFIIVVVEGYYTFYPKAQAVNPEVYNIQVPLQYVLYMLILWNAGDTKRYRRFLILALFGIVLFNTLTLIYFTGPAHVNVWGYCFCSVVIISAIIWKFYEMLKNPVQFNFLRNPFFYMLFAYLMFNLITLPYFSMANWLYHSKNYRGLSYLLADVMSCLNFLLYATYAICFLWIIKRKAIY